MKTTKQIGVVVSIAILVLFSACNNNASQQDAAKDAALRDSLEQVKLDSLKQVKIDSIAKIKEDSIRQDSIRRNRVTPDLALFELKGPVKSVNKGYISWFAANGANFDQNGKLISLNKSVNGYKLKEARDSKSHIKKIVEIGNGMGWQPQETFSYNKNSLPVKVSITDLDSGGDTFYSYNNGVLATETSSGCAGPEEYKTTITYTYLEFDSYGNWTKRKAKCVTRYISEEEGNFSTTKNETQTRKITYYE